VFFTFSKLFGFFTSPANLAIAIGICGCGLLATRWAPGGRRLMLASLLLLAVLGFLPVGNALIIPLEERFPPWNPAQGAPDGIVVLGGAISPEVSEARQGLALNEAAERVTIVAELALRYPNARIVFTGGTISSTAGAPSEAPFALRVFESFGIARERILLEERSRNTIENALFSKLLARPKPGERWLLVTSAYHMPRAIGAFRKAGFAVEAYPVDWRTRGIRDALVPTGGLADGLGRLDTAAHEWIGLFAYWLSGRSSELFPGPSQGGL
jgi:uncharacterized SAM-binding protein YcdF (DUF218 family)